MNRKTKLTIREACKKIWDRTNNQKGKHDGKGFNRIDRNFINDLIKQQNWTPRQKKAVHKTLKKYHRQFDEMDIDIETDIEKPPNVALNERDEDGQLTNKIVLTYENNQVLINVPNHIPNREDIIDEVKNYFLWDDDLKTWYTYKIWKLEPFLYYLRTHADDVSYKNDVCKKIKQAEGHEVDIYWHPEGHFRVDMEYECDNFETMKNKLRDNSNAEYNEESYEWEYTGDPEWLYYEFYYYDNVKIGSELQRQVFKDETLDNLYYELSSKKDAEYDEPDTFEGELEPFQRASVLYAVENNRTFISDSQGLGKSVIIICALEDLDSYPAIVVAPSNSKYKWKDEFVDPEEGFATHRDVQVISGESGEVQPGNDVYVINYKILKHRIADFVEADIRFESLVVDEIHNARNSDTDVNEYIHKIIEQHNPDVRYMLSGTPFKNAPEELIEPLKMLDRFDEFGGWKKFVTKYCAGKYNVIIACSNPKYQAVKNALHKVDAKHVQSTQYRIRPSRISEFYDAIKDENEKLEENNQPTVNTKYDIKTHWDTSGFSNTRELYKKLRETCMVRHTWDDVGDELPDINREVKRVSVDGYEQKEQEIQDEINHDSHGATKISKINELRQYVANEKRLEISRDVMDMLCDDNDMDKVIVFAYHREIVDLYEQEFGQEMFNTLKIKGGLSDEEYDEKQKEFQSGDCDVLVANIDACKEAIDLDEADAIIFGELMWTPTDHRQAEARARRLSRDSDRDVPVYYYVAENTIDDYIMNTLNKKNKAFDKIIDGIDNETLIPEDNVRSEVTQEILRSG